MLKLVDIFERFSIRNKDTMGDYTLLLRGFPVCIMNHTNPCFKEAGLGDISL